MDAFLIDALIVALIVTICYVIAIIKCRPQ